MCLPVNEIVRFVNRDNKEVERSLREPFTPDGILILQQIQRGHH